MNKKDFIALMAFAISRDLLDKEFVAVMEHFGDFIDKCMQYYDADAEKVIDIVIYDAQQDIKLGHSYGKYDKEIMKY